MAVPLQVSEIPPACYIQDTPDERPPSPSRIILSAVVAAVVLYLALR